MTAQVQDAGLANITAAWHAYASRARYLQWGVGTGQGVTDTDLDDKTGTTENRTAGTSSQVTVTTTSDTYQVAGTITSLSDALPITELGVFDAAGSGTPPSTGNMGMYFDFGVITLDTGDSITFTVKTTFDQA
jgi:hypothetical protein